MSAGKTSGFSAADSGVTIPSLPGTCDDPLPALSNVGMDEPTSRSTRSRKSTVLRFVRCLALGMMGFGVAIFFCAWVELEHSWFSWQMHPISLSLWPGVPFAQGGMVHTWIIPLVGMLALLAFSSFLLRRKHWMFSPGIGVLLAIGYLWIGQIVLLRLDVPAAANVPYALDSVERKAYLDGYREGYKTGMFGHFSSYCFRPVAETRGFYDGNAEGLAFFWRVLGRKELTEREKRMLRNSAAIDGVTTESDEQAVAPNASE